MTLIVTGLIVTDLSLSQVNVERLFSGPSVISFYLSNSLKHELLEAILLKIELFLN